MRGGDTLGVLSTSFGGFYFGTLLEGMRQAAEPHGDRIIAIQTADAGTFRTDFPEPPQFDHKVGWDSISAFVVILNAANATYLNAAQEAGKPIVMISDRLEGCHCPVVLPDNASGAAEAAQHLIDHGHRRIAYVGHLMQNDIRQRYDAYCSTLRKNGITPDPALFFDTGNNQERGGEVAARNMISAGLPCTAVMTGNDLNAIGFMRVIQAAGYVIPDDLAVVGFDDMDSAVFQVPALSSVHQPIASTGRLAVELLRRGLNGGPLEAVVHHVPTTFVARESCGCPSTIHLCAPDGTGRIESSAELAIAIGQATISRQSGSTVNVGRLTASVDIIAESLRSAAAGERGPGPIVMRDAMIDLHGIHPVPESIAAVIRCVRRYGDHVLASVPGDRDAQRRVEHCLQELIMSMAYAQMRWQFRDGEMFEDRFWRQNEVSMGLLRSHEEDPKNLDWVRQSSQVRGGCVGLWVEQEGGSDRTELELYGQFPIGELSQVPRQRCPMERFPPAELISLLDDLPGDMLYVVPMKVEDSDWGMLALIGPIEGRLYTSREDLNQWAALTTIAMDHRRALEALRQQQELLRHAAWYDQLTGLPNRAMLMQRLRELMDRAKRQSDYRFGMLLLDLDGFKIVNDSLGHLAGDELLVQVAARITADLRGADIAARFGGDEFAVLIDGIDDAETPQVIAERLHAVLSAPFQLDEQQVVIGASIGIAVDTAGYHTPEEIIRDADIAMYSAKNREKGTNAVFDAAMHARAVDRLRIEADLRQALERDELEVHYQPILDLRSGRPVSLEALLRWRHRERGLIGPGEFLPVAEESGLILPIGRWAIERACGQLREWQSRFDAPDLSVSINVSNREFWRGTLIDDLRTCIRHAGVDPGRVAIEVTEGVIMHDVRLAEGILRQLHELGVELHIDDFGTGYSSLEALQHLKIDALKIDRSFVSALGSDHRSDELARTIVAMGINLGLDLIAEGIETADQLEHLRRFGCGYGQGYWFSHPLPAEEAGPYLESHPPVSAVATPRDLQSAGGGRGGHRAVG